MLVFQSPPLLQREEMQFLKNLNLARHQAERSHLPTGRWSGQQDAVAGSGAGDLGPPAKLSVKPHIQRADCSKLPPHGPQASTQMQEALLQTPLPSAPPGSPSFPAFLFLQQRARSFREVALCRRPGASPLSMPIPLVLPYHLPLLGVLEDASLITPVLRPFTHLLSTN